MADKKARRNTRQRRVLLEELKRGSFHPSATELYEIARRRLPKISLGTVYRNLELLTQTGVIQKLETAGSEARFDGNVEQHYHVHCVRCGRLDDLHEVPAGPAKATFKSSSGYDIVGYRLECVGICPACKGTAAQRLGDAPQEQC